MIINKNKGELVCKACGGITVLDLSDKLGNYILKNPPKKDKSEKEHKAMEIIINLVLFFIKQYKNMDGIILNILF